MARVVLALLLIAVQTSNIAFRPPAGCRHWFGAACANWVLGPWLPSYGDSNNAWLEGHAVYIHRRDGFLYRGQFLTGKFGRGPSDGTFFVYGNAGPPKGRVVYDAVHRIAFYGQGCCSWFDLVAAADVRAPPRAVVRADLSALHTLRGVRLGMSPTQVMRVYGPGKMISVTAHPHMKMLAYTTWPPVSNAVQGAGPAGCGQFQNFYFRARRLVLIQLGNGC